MGRIRGGLTAMLVVALLLTGTAAGAQAPETDNASTAASGAGHGSDGRGKHDDGVRGVGDLTWGACTGTLAEVGAECAQLSVPLDYKRPNGTKIELAVSRVAHTVPDDQYQGAILINPGGPGGSGLIYAILAFFVPQDVAAAYDWIGFDPRGVGSSVPALSCIPDYFAGPRPDYVAVTPELERAWLDRSAAYSAACDAAGGDLLDHVSTLDTVQDMNAIRHALGETQINFYGFSYGTYLAQVFATKYPDRVRRMVLDSNVDPTRVWYGANLDQDVAFEVVFHRFLEWVARHDDVYGLGTTGAAVEAEFYQAQDDLRQSPQGILGPAEWTDAFVIAGYVQDFWPDVADAFAAFVNDGDPVPVQDLYVGFNDVEDDNGFAMYLATECTDARWPGSYARWRQDALRISRRAPFLTWDNTWFNGPCLTWPARSGRPVNVKDRGTPPILLVGETLDAATPFSGSLEVRRRFRSSVLIATEGGTTHANSLFGGNSCVDDQVFAYLRNGTLPDRLHGKRADAVCPALPEPEPAAPAIAAASAGGSTAALLSQLRIELVAAAAGHG